MQIRYAKKEDLDQALKIYAIGRKFMAENGNPTQWPDDSYPARDLLEYDIEQERLYVFYKEEAPERIYGVFVLLKTPEPTYSEIDGAWPNNDTYVTIHRICTSQEEHGLAGMAFDFAKSQCNNVRVDTHKDNLPMQRAAKSAGFKYCGIVKMLDGTDRLAFQWVKQ